MPIERIYAQINCTDIDRSIDWFTRLFGRAPDARPMPEDAEWVLGQGGLQLYLAPEHAGHGTLTLAVDDAEAMRAEMQTAGLSPGEVERGGQFTLVRMRDPDGNLVVLAQAA